MEVAEKLALTDIPASSFIKSAKVYEENSGKIIIKLSTDFAVTMLSRPNTKEALKKSLSACLFREINDADVVIEVNAGDDSEKYDILDELAED
jgi:hypothetical protein